MYIPLRYLISPVAGIDTFMISETSDVYKITPDIMRIKCYHNYIPYILNTLTLPKLYDIIEYDYRLHEWFINIRFGENR